MKKAFLLISIITIHSNLIFAQISSVFAIENTGDKDVGFYVNFYKKGVYEIEISAQLTDDQVEGIIISYGNYTLKNGIIELKDIYNGFDMQFSYNGEYMISSKTFKWLVNKKFVKTSYTTNNRPTLEAFRVAPVIQERFKFEPIEKIINPLKIGEYGSRQYYRGQWLSLKILPGNQYRFAFKKFILSEGVYYRKGNELVLFDTGLKQHFYNTIGPDGIYNLFFPAPTYEGILVLQ